MGFSLAPAETIHGRDYESLKTVAARLGMGRGWAETGKTQILRSEWTSLRFELHKRVVRVNGVGVHLGFPIAARNGDLWITKVDYQKNLAHLLQSHLQEKAPQLRHIFIDPGHGGKDPGARNTQYGLIEKEVALDVSKRLARHLRNSGYRVTIGRTEDVTIARATRPRMARRAEADLFISVHFNAANSSSVNGTETFIFTPRGQPSSARGKLTGSDLKTYAGNAHDGWNAVAGFQIQQAMVETLGLDDRGLKRARFDVLRDLHCPGLLVEPGFLSNAAQARKLKQGSYRETIARSIAEGVFAYHRTLERVNDVRTGYTRSQ